MWRILHAVGLAVLMLAIVCSAWLDVPVRSPQFLIGMFIALAIWGIPMSQLALLDCPGCHRRFFGLLIVAFLFQARCSHCALPQYDDDSNLGEEI